MSSASPISCGHDTITVGASSVGLTAANIPAAAHSASIHTTAEIRIWLDGTAPTATVGMPIDAGEDILLQSRHELENFRAIATGPDSTLSVIYHDSYVE